MLPAGDDPKNPDRSGQASLLGASNALELLSFVFEETPQAMYVVDLDGVVLRWNAAAEGLFGWCEREAIGERLPHVPEDLQLRMVCDIRAIGEGSKPGRQTGVVMHRDGSTFKTELVIMPIIDHDGHTTGALTIAASLQEVFSGNRPEDEFASVITQELRGPLTAILGYAQLLARPEILDDPVRRSRTLKSLQDRGARMAQLVDDLILSASIDRQGLSLSRERVDLALVATDVVGRVESRKVPHRFILEMDPNVPPVEGDHRLISDAIERLLVNAITYSPDGGDVVVSVRMVQEGGIVAVADSGIGLSATEHSRVFERFYQADMSPDRRFRGMGLGLYIVDAIAQAHGGSVAASARQDGGSRFIMYLPFVCGETPRTD